MYILVWSETCLYNRMYMLVLSETCLYNRMYILVLSETCLYNRMFILVLSKTCLYNKVFTSVSYYFMYSIKYQKSKPNLTAIGIFTLYALMDFSSGLKQ